MKKFKVVCYMRIDPEDDAEALPIKEAHRDRKQLELMQPENIYLIEAVDESQ